MLRLECYLPGYIQSRREKVGCTWVLNYPDIASHGMAWHGMALHEKGQDKTRRGRPSIRKKKKRKRIRG